MRVGIGVTVLSRSLRSDDPDGIGHYTRELIASISRSPGIELVPISFGAQPPDSLAAHAIVYGRYPLLAAMAALTGRSFPGGGALRDRVDVVHATDHLVPKFRGIPTVATLMDAIPLSHPEWVAPRLLFWKSLLWKRAAAWAQQVITISEHSKTDIIQHFGIAPERVSVVPLGVDERYFETLPPEVRSEVLQRLGLPQRFFLFVGTLQPRKNLERILRAHRRLPLDMQKEVPLVVAGRPGWRCEGVIEQLRQGRERGTVQWLRYVPDLDLRALLQSAAALVFPSLYEGFGLPILEAFASGLPVITASTSAMPEVAGDAALLVDALDEQAIADAMQRVLESPEAANELRRRGLARAREFSWAQCAERTLVVYRKTIG